jgi:hypothetical protein
MYSDQQLETIQRLEKALQEIKEILDPTEHNIRRLLPHKLILKKYKEFIIKDNI